MEQKSKPTKVVLMESDEAEEAIRAKMADKRLVTLDLWVRKPDSEKLTQLRPAARLCSCESICIAVFEDEL